MTFGQFMLRTLFPSREQERMEFRGAVQRAAANAEDLIRDLAKCPLLKGIQDDQGTGESQIRRD